MLRRRVFVAEAVRGRRRPPRRSCSAMPTGPDQKSSSWSYGHLVAS
ncbi:MAG: hypothetical protein AVDCRST_MAG83-1929 [uncultured Arthrobacter sp.]|uniref:Uncharacterized protein n=1 Tax=uncultured Arthrobacter sp. TaxID=114050 RepID=A0A6J4IAD1_9MICC|nr:MAG: hypothetical protein AVDCRST_MAG83-1929 [uncultured Arthrobacter sp.]